MSKKIDTLYLQGKEQVDPFTFYYNNLRPLLIQYASAICQKTLRRVDVHLVTEMVDDLLMDLGAFRGDSTFSVWVYPRFYRTCVDEIRSRPPAEKRDRPTSEPDTQQSVESRTIVENGIRVTYLAPSNKYCSRCEQSGHLVTDHFDCYQWESRREDQGIENIPAPNHGGYMVERLAQDEIRKSLPAELFSVYKLRSEGYTVADIATKLGLSLRTTGRRVADLESNLRHISR